MIRALRHRRHCTKRSLSRVLAGLLAPMVLLASTGVSAATSSWSPTLLVNTESFQVIDEGDQLTDVEIRFGGTLNEKLYWNRAPARFEFTDDLHVQGNITGSGTLTVSGEVKTKADLSINSDSGAADAVLTFGSDSTNETLKFLNAEDRFEFSDDLNVTGGLYASGSLVVSNASRFKSNLRVSGNISGSLIKANNFMSSGAIAFTSGGTLSRTAQGTSGQIILSQGLSAPVWKTPTSSMVWFFEGGLFVTATGGAVVTMPYGITLGTGSLRVNVAPTGAAIIVDVFKDGTSIYSTKPQIAVSAKTSAKTGIFSTTALTEGSVIRFSIDQVGSTIAGSGLTIMLNGTRKY
ncbi:hypothetical protein HYZ99_03230 [Candidatus Peregrinibacteria bacterium]|nr:hypothetical protein [Candidatus Peregrinibacteria bacterium]